MGLNVVHVPKLGGVGDGDRTPLLHAQLQFRFD
jgi:hypothetical protein